MLPRHRTATPLPNANGNASPLSLLSSALLGGAECGAGRSSPNVKALRTKMPSLPPSTNKRRRIPMPVSSPKPNVAPQAFSAQQTAGQPLGTLIGSKTPNGAPTGLAQSAATTQSVSNRQLAASGANDLPPAPASNGGKPRIALVPGNNPNAGSDPSVAAANGNGRPRLSSAKRRGSLIVRALRQQAMLIQSARRRTTSRNPSSCRMSRRWLQMRVLRQASSSPPIFRRIHRRLRLPHPMARMARARDGRNARERARNSRKPVDQSATVGDGGGSNEAVDPMAQAILVAQSGPARLRYGRGRSTASFFRDDATQRLFHSHRVRSHRSSIPSSPREAQMIRSRRSAQTLRPTSK